MTIRASGPTLNLHLKPSRHLLVFFLGVHFAAGLALLLLDLQLWWLMGGWVLVAAHAGYTWYSTQWLRSITHLQYCEGDFYVFQTDGKQQATVAGGHFVVPWLVILHLKVAGKPRFLPLFKDSSDSESLRQLRVLLRCRSGRSVT